jgi:hypothetical protein
MVWKTWILMIPVGKKLPTSISRSRLQRQALGFLPDRGEYRKFMVGHGIVFFKSLLKSSLDNYILPGTLTGTEILWLYMLQWKRDFTNLTLATAYLMYSQIVQSSRLEKIGTRSEG